MPTAATSWISLLIVSSYGVYTTPRNHFARESRVVKRSWLRNGDAHLRID